MCPAVPRLLSLALLAFLPLVKWTLPAGGWRHALFFGGGSALTVLLVWRSGAWPALRPLFASPWRGLLGALYGFALLMALAMLVLYFPPVHPLLTYALYDLLALLDPVPVYVAFQRGDLSPQVGTMALVGLGAAVEEWIFRMVLFWRWLAPPQGQSALPSSPGAAAALGKLGAVSVYFAALHWPQPPQALLTALLGSFAMGLVLMWKRNFALITGLHVLFNWKIML